MAARGNQLVEDWGSGILSGNLIGLLGGSDGGFNPCSSIASKRRTSVRYCSAGVIILFTQNWSCKVKKLSRKKLRTITFRFKVVIFTHKHVS